MQQEKKPLPKDCLNNPDRNLLHDLERILEGMEYKEHLTQFGESAPKTQMFLVEHPEARRNFNFAKKVFGRLA